MTAILSPYIPTIIIALVFAVVRFFLPSKKPDFGFTGWYKAFAHIGFGGLFGYAAAAWDYIPAIIAAVMLAVEIIAFVTHQPEAGHA